MVFLFQIIYITVFCLWMKRMGCILTLQSDHAFLVHLCRRLKCTIVIIRCLSPSSLTFQIFNFSETAEQNSTKIDRKQDLHALYKVCVFGPIKKTRWLPWPLIRWDIFDFSSETAKRNSTKLDRKQDLKVLYQVCVFRAN